MLMQVKPDSETDDYVEDIDTGIVFTLGYVPGLKVDAIPLLRTAKVTNLAPKHEFVVISNRGFIVEILILC